MQNKFRKALPWFGAILVITAMLWPALRPSAKPEKAAAAKPARAALPVHTVTIQFQALEESVAATGTVRAEESIDVQPEVSGKLLKIFFQEGTVVRAGELLARINDSELRATYQRAVYRRELASLKVRRVSQLVANGGVTQQEYDIAVSELNVLEAEVSLIDAQLARTEIRAPFDGIIGLRNVSEGAYVTPLTKIATFQRLDQLKVDFALPEKYAYRIKPDSEVSISVAGGGQPLQGRVYAVDPRIDGATRTVLIRALCPNPGGRLLSGGFVSVRVALARVPDAILVPSFAVLLGVNEKSVLVVENGKVGRRVVSVGTRTNSAVQIVDGLRPGDTVITSGLQQLREGQPVRVLEPESTEATHASAPKLASHHSDHPADARKQN
ncbi:MAG TPA: efflux RND transporter periplasmic adaptor subunit [Lacunisphaera sp.]